MKTKNITSSKLNNNMKFLIIIALLLISNSLLASPAHDELVHLAAHVGMSYAVNTISYGFYKKSFKLTVWESLVYSGLTTLAIGFIYKAISNGGNTLNMGPSMGKNVIGIGASILTIVVYRWN